MIKHRNRFITRLLVPLMATGMMTGGALVVTATPAFAAMSASACAYTGTVTLFSTEQMGCSPNTDGDASTLAPSLSGTGTSSSSDTDGAMAVFGGVATMFSSPYDPNDGLDPSGTLTVERDINGTSGYVSARADTVGPTPFFTLSAGYQPAWAEPAKPGGTTTHANTGSEQPQQMNGDGTGATWDGTKYVGSGTGYVSAQCTANSNGSETGAVSIVNGVVDTHITASGVNAGYPSESVAIPSSPSANYRVNYWIENVNDSGHIIFNEQTWSGPGQTGFLTVNAVHIVMEGSHAYGDLIIGQAVCGQ
jgi:hypothetical protein